MSKRSFKQMPKRWRGLVPRSSMATAIVAASLASTGVAHAAPAPGWEATSRMYPTHLAPGSEGTVVVEVYNVGAGTTTGPVTLTDALPSGLEAVSAGPVTELGAISKSSLESREKTYAKKEEEQALGKVTTPQSQPRVWKCEGTTTVACTTVPGYGGIERPIRPGYRGRVGIKVKAVGGPGVVENHVTVAGGGASGPAEATDDFTISETPAAFGLAGEFDGWFSTGAGTIDTQAGSHPFDLTLSFGLNVFQEAASGAMRDIEIALPRGIVGDPHATAQCTRQQLFKSSAGSCPVNSAVGIDEASRGNSASSGEADFDVLVPVYNMVPPAGIPAEFAFTIFGSTVLIDASVRSGSDYGITTVSRNVGFRAVFNTVTLWGVPGESAHDPERCGEGPLNQPNVAVACGYKGTEATPLPLLTLPTSCEGPLTTNLTIDSWDKSLGSASESFVTHDQTGASVGLTGCEHLAFSPSLSVSPDTSYADTPAGLTADVKMPQEGLSRGEGVATANIKDTTVVLPEGVAINPGQAAGLGACGSGEDGLTTPAEEAEAKEDDGPAHCPNASKVGTDEIETPLLSKPLKGGVYVLPSNPPHVKLLVTAEGEGVFVKLVAKVDLDEATGRLTTTFEKTPELPFTDFKLSFSGGAQAALSTPTQCGAYTTTSDFMPWSSPFEQDAFPSSSFVIAAGPNGGPCPASPLPFGPSMIAGSTTDQAGGFTDFSLLLTRPDDQQRIGSLRFKTPEGLLGMIGKVPLCGEAQANAGTCSSASQIGHTVVEAGPGPYPLVVPQPGQPPAPIYLTGGYKGAPYGLSIVVPLHVGPFVLPTQVVRAKIEVDPRTTELTVTTDALPQIIAGVPADLRAIDAVIDRPGFMFNPTGCESSSFSGAATSSQGATASISSHFQMGSCRSLAFKPVFKVSTSAKTSRANGASLDAKITYPKGPFGENQASIQSNVKSVKVDLPKQLPSRLTTLQKACPAKT
ncbi:MAG TPA: hypothetical protein VFW38_10870, partial [Solirubrobacteraceae bacterium]|nr:hypothetical protein [Solirubrobacteraceae bacterium]